MGPARFARASMVAATTVVFAAVGAVPAHAQAEAALDMFFRDVTIPTAGPGVTERVVLLASEPVELEQIMITIDFSDIASFATVTAANPTSGDCTTPAEHVLSCINPFPIPVRVDPALELLPKFVIAPTAAATAGDEGVLRITVQADDFPPLSHDSRVRAGTGVNLTGGPPVEREAGVGESFTTVVQVTNTGDSVVNGVGLRVFQDYALRAGQTFSNCTYVDNQPVTCRFDQVLSPGTYQVLFPYMVRPDTFAPGFEGAEYRWSTAAELDDEMTRLEGLGVDVGQPGTGSLLELTEVATFGAAGVEADVEPADNWTRLDLQVTGDNGVDIAAVGDTLTGVVGDLVKAVVGVKNNGPATIDRSRIGSSAAPVSVTVPPGTTAVTVPTACMPRTESGQGDLTNQGEPGWPRYICFGSSILPAGEASTFEITLRIDRTISNAAGAVSILEPCQCDHWPLDLDLDHSNNLASILLNPTSGGDGPSLADTGRSVGAIVAVGGLLLLLGIVVVAFTVRRRGVVR